jgi:hypothetical protein
VRVRMPCTYTLLLTNPYKLTLITAALRRPCVVTVSGPCALAYSTSAHVRVALAPPQRVPSAAARQPGTPLPPTPNPGGSTRTAFAAGGNGSMAAVRERAAAPAVTVAELARIAQIASPRISPASHALAFNPSAQDRGRGKP